MHRHVVWTPADEMLCHSKTGEILGCSNWMSAKFVHHMFVCIFRGSAEIVVVHPSRELILVCVFVANARL